mmetsp:Transcript_23789/g.47786  ORF Transcript_23789/g.47786 Transcript_23789/m.47786 type:complete len:201 (+) Transcript_23789:381-983(+)
MACSCWCDVATASSASFFFLPLEGETLSTGPALFFLEGARGRAGRTAAYLSAMRCMSTACRDARSCSSARSRARSDPSSRRDVWSALSFASCVLYSVVAIICSRACSISGPRVAEFPLTPFTSLSTASRHRQKSVLSPKHLLCSLGTFPRRSTSAMSTSAAGTRKVAESVFSSKSSHRSRCMTASRCNAHALYRKLPFVS